MYPYLCPLNLSASLMPSAYASLQARGVLNQIVENHRTQHHGAPEDLPQITPVTLSDMVVSGS